MVPQIALTTDCSVALVVLFADSLNALVPDVSTTAWKFLSFLIFIPLSFVPLNILSYTSILGILGTIGREIALEVTNQQLFSSRSQTVSLKLIPLVRYATQNRPFFSHSIGAPSLLALGYSWPLGAVTAFTHKV